MPSRCGYVYACRVSSCVVTMRLHKRTDSRRALGRSPGQSTPHPRAQGKRVEGSPRGNCSKLVSGQLTSVSRRRCTLEVLHAFVTPGGGFRWGWNSRIPVVEVLLRVSPGALWTRSARPLTPTPGPFRETRQVARSGPPSPRRRFADRTGCRRLESRGSGRKLPKRKRIKARRGRLFHPHPTLAPTPRPSFAVRPAVAILSPISAPTITPTIRPGELVVGSRDTLRGSPGRELRRSLS